MTPVTVKAAAADDMDALLESVAGLFREDSGQHPSSHRVAKLLGCHSECPGCGVRELVIKPTGTLPSGRRRR